MRRMEAGQGSSRRSVKRSLCQPQILSLSIRDPPTPTVLVGDDALAHRGEDAIPGTHSGSPPGMQRLLAILQEKYGTERQEQVTQDIDDFLDLRRGRHSLLEFIIEFEHRYDHARISSGFTLNEVGRSHILLKQCIVDQTAKNHKRLFANSVETSFYHREEI